MGNNIRNIYVLGLVASAVAALAACGGGDSSAVGSAPAAPAPAPQTIQGKVVDFYIAGATVSFDDCGGQAATDTSGGFAFPSGCAASALTVTGGFDVATQVRFSGALRAPKSKASAGAPVMVTPLTTLMSMVDESQAATIATKLGLPAGTDLLHQDPMQNAAAMRVTVVAQQLLTQISSTLMALAATGTDGRLTPTAAADAAAAALAVQIGKSSGTFSLTDSANIQSVIQAAVNNAVSALPSKLRRSADSVAANVAALSTASIAKKVSATEAALQGAVIGPSFTETMRNLGGKLDTIAQVSSSPAAMNLISSVGAAVLADGNLGVRQGLARLGAAVVPPAPVQSVRAALSALANELPADERIVSTSQLENIESFTDFIQLSTVSLIGTGDNAFSIEAVQGSNFPGGELQIRANALDQVAVVLRKAVAEDAREVARVGLSYTIGSNQVDLIIDKVEISFNSAGMLTNAIVPAGTPYSFRVNGAAAASATLTNGTADKLGFASSVDPLHADGVLLLPIATFLAKLSAVSPPVAAKIASFKPKAGDIVSVSIVMGTAADAIHPVRVGTGSGTGAKPADQISVTTGAATVVGLGVNARIKLDAP